MYVAVPVAAGVTLVEPLAACDPLQPPLAVQLVPVLDDQVSVALWPSVIDDGATDIEIVGAGGAELPPPPPPPQAPSAIVTSKIQASAGRRARCAEWKDVSIDVSPVVIRRRQMTCRHCVCADLQVGGSHEWENISRA